MRLLLNSINVQNETGRNYSNGLLVSSVIEPNARNETGRNGLRSTGRSIQRSINRTQMKCLK